MKVLLDENFPLGLLRALQADGVVADHVITVGWRGVSDRERRERIRGENVLFLTQDTEFLMADTEPFTVIILSRSAKRAFSPTGSPFAIERFGKCLATASESWRTAEKRIARIPASQPLDPPYYFNLRSRLPPFPLFLHCQRARSAAPATESPPRVRRDSDACNAASSTAPGVRRVRELTRGASQPANVALVVNNACLAAQIACAFAARDQRGAPNSNDLRAAPNDATPPRGGRGRRGRANSLTAVRTLRRVPQTEPDPSTAE